MASRRNFLAAAMGGLGFCGCSMRPTSARAATAVRLPITVGGKKIRTVDTHTHCYSHIATHILLLSHKW